MGAHLKAQVRRRAHFRCEYCHFPERYAELRFQLDHIRAEQHGGRTVLANLAWSCLRCNKHKGPNLSGIDPKTNRTVRLFSSAEGLLERALLLGGIKNNWADDDRQGYHWCPAM